MSEYDQVYSQDPAHFGTGPTPLLERFVERIPAGGRVLDIGVGQGRNALVLARSGFQVTGIDTSEVAIRTVTQVAAREKLPVTLWHGNFLDYRPAEPFAAILCFGLLQTLSRRDGASLMYRLLEWTRPAAWAFLTAWHVDDPAYDQVRSQAGSTWETVGCHSFRDRDGRYRTYLARGEILDLMAGWRVIHLWEGLGPEHRHGDGPSEQHGVIEVVAVKLDPDEVAPRARV